MPTRETFTFFLRVISTLNIVPADSKHESADESITETKAARTIPATSGERPDTAVGIASEAFSRPGYKTAADRAITPIATAKIILKTPENIAQNPREYCPSFRSFLVFCR